MTAAALTTYLDNSAHVTWDARNAKPAALELAERFSYGTLMDECKKITSDPFQKNAYKKSQILFDVLKQKMEKDGVHPAKVNEIGNLVLNSTSSVMNKDDRDLQGKQLHEELKAIAPADFTLGARLKRTFGLGN